MHVSAEARNLLVERIAEHVERMSDADAARLLRGILRYDDGRPSPVAWTLSEIAFSNGEMAALVVDAVAREALPGITEALESHLQDGEGRLSYPRAFVR